MFQIITFWVMVSIITFLTLIGPYFLIAKVISLYTGKMHFSVRGDRSDANQFERNTLNLLMSPVSWVYDKIGLISMRDHVIPTAVSIMTIFTFALPWSFEDAPSGYNFVSYFIGQMSAFSQLAAEFLGGWIAIAVVLLLLHGVFVKVFQKFDVIKRKLDSLNAD